MGFRGIRLMGAVAVTLASAACSRDATSPPKTVAGSWFLRTVGGKALPYDFGNGASAAADDLIVSPAGTYVELFRAKWSAAYHDYDPVSYPLDTTYRIEGAWTASGKVVTFGSSADDIWKASFEGDSLVVQGAVSQAIYRR
jgi:hypothetical protein